MSIYSCIDNIIGFTRREDSCVDGYDPAYSDSESGLYVDELQGMSLRIHDAMGGHTDVWEKLVASRENAINTFKTDILQEVIKYKEPIRSYFNGDIGYKTFTRVTTKKTYNGLRMFSDIKGGKFTLRGVSLILDSTEAVNLEIYDEYDLLYTYPLTSQAGRPKRTDITPLELPLDRNYYFVISSVGLPYNNKLTCGCGGYKWCFNTEDPCYRYSKDRWTEWSMVGGVQGDDLTIRDDWSISKNSNGMILHGNFTCSAFDSLCGEDSDFVNDPIDSSIAWAILYKTGEFMTNYVMDTGEVSRYTLLGVEALNENRIYYNKRYAVMVDYIAKNIPDEKTDCYRCRQPMGMGKRTHLI